MKKIWGFVFLCLSFLFLSSISFASELKTLYFDDVGMSIGIPSDYYIITRDYTNIDDATLSAMGITKSNINSMFNASNMYLDSFDKDARYEIKVVINDCPLNDFTSLSDTEIKLFVSGLEAEYKNNGIRINNYDVYKHEQTKFAKLYVDMPSGDETQGGIQYLTVYGGKCVVITLKNSLGLVFDSKERYMDSIIDAIHFDPKPVALKEVEHTNPFVYIDSETNCCFTIPKDWTQKPFYEDRKYLDAKFESNLEAGLIITYNSDDLYGFIPVGERQGTSRREYNNSMFSIQEIAELFDTRVQNVSVVNYNNKDYFKIEGKQISTFDDYDFSITAVSLIRIENGYLYMFYFLGDSDSPYYKDFESLIESVRYPGTFALSEEGYTWLGILIALLLTFWIYSLPIFLYRYCFVKHPIDKKKAKIITIGYGVYSFIIMSFVLYYLSNTLASVTILIYIWINYAVLTKGKEERPITQTVKQTDKEKIE